MHAQVTNKAGTKQNQQVKGGGSIAGEGGRRAGTRVGWPRVAIYPVTKQNRLETDQHGNDETQHGQANQRDSYKKTADNVTVDG